MTTVKERNKTKKTTTTEKKKVEKMTKEKDDHNENNIPPSPDDNLTPDINDLDEGIHDEEMPESTKEVTKYDSNLEHQKNPKEIAIDTMAGDVRDFILKEIEKNHSPVPWNLATEAEQEKTIQKVTEFSENFVKRIVFIVETKGTKVISGTLGKMVFDKSIKTELTIASYDPLRNELIDRKGGNVWIILSDVSKFMGTRGEVVINKDQTDLEDIINNSENVVKAPFQENSND